MGVEPGGDYDSLSGRRGGAGVPFVIDRGRVVSNGCGLTVAISVAPIAECVPRGGDQAAGRIPQR